MKNKDMYFLPAIECALRQPDARSALGVAFREIEAVGRSPEYRRGLEQFHQFMAAAISHLNVTVNITRHEHVIGTVVSNPFLGLARLHGIMPGDYKVTLSTGRVIWEGVLTEADVLWAQAFPGAELRLAADSGEVARRFSHKEILVGGEIILYVFPGVESGEIGIEIQRKDGK
jgi:hypothetical protein